MQVCERSLTSSSGGPAGPPLSTFVRAEMLPSGYLIRACDGGGSILHIVDHIDLDVSFQLLIITFPDCVYTFFIFSQSICRFGVFLKFLGHFMSHPRSLLRR